MPVIEDTSQEAALRLQRAAEPLSPPDDEIVIVSGHGGGFLVSDDLLAAYETDVSTLPAPTEPSCRSGNPCYAAMCGEDLPTAAPTLTTLAPNTRTVGAATATVTLTGTQFVAPMTASINPPGADATFTVTATPTSTTSATISVPASSFDTAGTVAITVTTPNGTSSAQNITVA